MKLSCVLLLALAAVVAADSYEQYQTSYSQEEPQSSHLSSRRSRPAKKQGIAGSVLRDNFRVEEEAKTYPSRNCFQERGRNLKPKISDTDAQ